MGINLLHSLLLFCFCVLHGDVVDVVQVLCGSCGRPVFELQPLLRVSTPDAREASKTLVGGVHRPVVLQYIQLHPVVYSPAPRLRSERVDSETGGSHVGEHSIPGGNRNLAGERQLRCLRISVFAPCGARGAATAAAPSWGGKNDIMLCWPLGGGPPAAAPPPSLMMVVIGSGVVCVGLERGGAPRSLDLKIT